MSATKNSWTLISLISQIPRTLFQEQSLSMPRGASPNTNNRDPENSIHRIDPRGLIFGFSTSPPVEARRLLGASMNRIGAHAVFRDSHRQDESLVVEPQLVDAHRSVIAIGFAERTAMIDDVPVAGG
jgi:hypothetical protein